MSKKTVLSVQKATGPICRICKRVCEIHNYTVGSGMRIKDGCSTEDDTIPDLRCWCSHCGMYVLDPILEPEDAELPDQPPF